MLYQKKHNITDIPVLGLLRIFLTEGSLGEVQAGQVVSFGAGLLPTEHQLPAVPAAETLVIRLLPLSSPLLILSLQPLPFRIGCLAILWMRHEGGDDGKR